MSLINTHRSKISGNYLSDYSLSGTVLGAVDIVMDKNGQNCLLS